MTDPHLKTAVMLWRAGKTIPCDLWAILSGRGYDMHRLEHIHTNA